MTFSTTATAGRNDSVVSSWNDDTSSTAASSGRPTSESAGVPTLPAIAARSPAARSISVTSAVVVDFPFVPVTATIGTESAAPASSMSPHTRRARVR